MTGIERLREVVRELGRFSFCYDLYETLCAIADQIEAEQDERVTRRLEDREAAEWVRAHGGLDAVKERWGDSVPFDVYRRKRDKLLGHIDECETALRKRKQRIEDLGRLIQSRNDEWAMMHNEFEHMRLDHIEGLAFEKLVDDIAARLGVSVMGFDSQDTRDRIMPVLERRLMPEGYEWPRYESGEPVRIGDPFSDHWGCENVVDSVEVGDCWFKIHGFDGVAPRYSKKASVKRPEPKVLDADGVEIRKGDVVYLLPGSWCDEFPCLGYHGGEELEVLSPHADHVLGGIGCRDTRRPKGTCCPQPSQLTHRAPVRAADGRPLREGEHVYHVETGTELVVKELPKPGEYQAVVVFALPKSPASHLTSFDPDQLTHERPDSWERLEEDADKEACEYFAHMPCGCETSEMLDETVENCNAAKARDLVRRARALAERERGE